MSVTDLSSARSTIRSDFSDAEESQLQEHVVFDSGAKFEQADADFQFAAAVAGFGMLLRDSEYRGDWDYETVMQVAQSSIGADKHGFREEFIELVSIARMLDAELEN